MFYVLQHLKLNVPDVVIKVCFYINSSQKPPEHEAESAAGYLSQLHLNTLPQPAIT